jgi:hypothetical protein
MITSARGPVSVGVWLAMRGRVGEGVGLKLREIREVHCGPGTGGDGWW